jgi:hypothetical protein
MLEETTQVYAFLLFGVFGSYQEVLSRSLGDLFNLCKVFRYYIP